MGNDSALKGFLGERHNMILPAYKMRPDYINQPFKCSGQIYDGHFPKNRLTAMALPLYC